MQLLLCTRELFHGVHAKYILPHLYHHVPKRGLSVQLPAVVTGRHEALSVTGISFTKALAKQFVKAENESLSLEQQQQKGTELLLKEKTVPS